MTRSQRRFVSLGVPPAVALAAVALAFLAVPPDQGRPLLALAVAIPIAAGVVPAVRRMARLRRAEEHHRLLVEQMADGLFVADSTGRYVDVNPAGCQMFGMTREEILACSIHDLIVPEQAALLPKCLEWRPDYEVKRSEWRYRRKDGSTFDGEVSSRFLPNGLLQGILRDVSERKQAERALARSAATFEALIAANPFGVYLVDADFRLRVVSRGAERVFEHVRPLIGRDFAEVMRHVWPEPFASEAIGRFRHTLESGEPFDSPGTVERRRDIDAIEAYDWHIERVAMPDGRFGVVCYFYDLSERQDWERRLRAATEVAEVGMYQWDVVRDTTWWDERLRRWWGLGPDEPVTYERFLAGVHPADRARVHAGAQSAIDASGPGRCSMTYRVAAPGQPVRWVRSAGRAEFADGRAVLLSGALLDVTVEHEQELALREMDRRKDEFLATLSHELRNPLAPIRSAAELLGHEDVSPGQVTWAQSVIRRQAGHMARLLDDLLDVARITRGKLVLMRERVPLAALVDTALETARPAIAAKQHQLDVSLPAGEVQLDVDPHRMAQALANLLTNAARYTEPGGRITLRAAREGAALVIRVRDTGMGIPAAALPTLFDMFSQVESTSRQRDGGLGIGLALVRGLVELHGGSVSARSDGPGQGSEFSITLPRATLVPAPGEPVLPAEERDTAGAARVLVADDNRDAADSLGELLRIAGFDVHVTYGGEEALRSARLYRPDVMLVDLGMPDLSGYEVASVLRAEPWAGTVRLVAVTGWGQESDRAQALAAGFDAHMTKPVEFSGIRSLITRMAASG